MDPSWIDQAFVWVQHPFFVFVFLLVMVVLAGWLLWGFHKRQQAENSRCWELYEQAQQEILELTGFVVEAVSLAGQPRSKEQKDQLADLETRVGQFKDQKQRQLERDRAARAASKSRS